MCAKRQATSGGSQIISPVVDGLGVMTALLLFPFGQLEKDPSMFLNIEHLCHILQLPAGITVF
jgi:hypothetical protein